MMRSPRPHPHTICMTKSFLGLRFPSRLLSYNIQPTNLSRRLLGGWLAGCSLATLGRGLGRGWSFGSRSLSCRSLSSSCRLGWWLGWRPVWVYSREKEMRVNFLFLKSINKLIWASPECTLYLSLAIESRITILTHSRDLNLAAGSPFMYMR